MSGNERWVGEWKREVGGQGDKRVSGQGRWASGNKRWVSGQGGWVSENKRQVSGKDDKRWVGKWE